MSAKTGGDESEGSRMKFSADVLKQFNLEPEEEKEPVNVMKISEMLDFMKVCAERIDSKSKRYIECGDAEVQMDCMDIVTAKLNDFTQVFKDLIIFMRKEERTHKGGVSLRYCMVSFDTFGFEKTEAEQAFLKELLLRNEITHDYFNRELHQQKLIWIMTNCSQGAVDVCDDLRTYC
ncbi:MAG: hypothetical protein Q4F29_13305, partial [Lachnospiraceae bacterium]|nr:hypothetical protein [Lachnospiraceae bacterium]